MTIEEYATLEIATGANLVKTDGIWWRHVRPFFYRPLFPLLNLTPGSKKPPLSYIFGGYQHCVPRPEMANSYMSVLLFDNIHEYSIDKLKHDYRKNIRKGQKNFTIQAINDINEFIDNGHPIYISFYERTKYSWKHDRADYNAFASWAEMLFRFPKLLILGAYHQNVLSAISISCLVENLLIYSTFLCDAHSLKLRVSELMLHFIREMSSECKNADYIYMGTLADKVSLNTFKIDRGCKVLSRPAFLKTNPLLLFLTKYFKRKDYNKLLGKV